VDAVGEETEPKDNAAGLAFGGAGHGDADDAGEVAPVGEDREGARNAHGGEVAVVGEAAGGGEAVLVGAEGCAVGEKGLVERVGVSSAEGGFVDVDALAEEPQDGVGEALGDVGGGDEAEAEDVFDDPGGDGGAEGGGEPEEGGFEPFGGVGGKLVEEVLEVVGELEQREAEDVGSVLEDGHVVGEVVERWFDFGDPRGEA